ncbi:Hypothetical protein CINCED_3A005932, partial [Cinara cedri]
SDFEYFRINIYTVLERTSNCVWPISIPLCMYVCIIRFTGVLVLEELWYCKL